MPVGSCCLLVRLVPSFLWGQTDVGAVEWKLAADPGAGRQHTPPRRAPAAPPERTSRNSVAAYLPAGNCRIRADQEIFRLVREMTVRKSWDHGLLPEPLEFSRLRRLSFALRLDLESGQSDAAPGSPAVFHTFRRNGFLPDCHCSIQDNAQFSSSPSAPVAPESRPCYGLR